MLKLILIILETLPFLKKEWDRYRKELERQAVERAIEDGGQKINEAFEELDEEKIRSVFNGLDKHRGVRD